MSRVCIAADVGGTKIAAAIVDQSGKVLQQIRRATDAQAGGAAVLANLQAALASLDTSAFILAGIGVSAAGVIDPRRGVVASSSDAMPGWAGQDIGAALAAYGVPVACANDVHSALAGELWRNPSLAAVRGNVVMLTLGTGLGGAIAVDGQIMLGAKFVAGHFGRTLVQHQGRPVPLDSLVSGTGLCNLYRLLGGGEAHGSAVLERASAGEAAAVAALSDWLDQLALLLHNICWTLDPAAIVLGGGVIDGRRHWWPHLSARMARVGIAVPLAPASLGNDAGVIGAAHLAWRIAGSAA